MLAAPKIQPRRESNIGDMEAFRGLPGFRNPASFSTWLHWSALNTTHSFPEPRKRSRVQVARELAECSGGTSQNQDRPALKRELEGEIRTALAELSAELRPAVVLTVLQELWTSRRQPRSSSASPPPSTAQSAKRRKQVESKLRPYLLESRRPSFKQRSARHAHT